MSVSEEALLLDGFESGIKRRAIEHVLSLHCSMEKGHAMSFFFFFFFFSAQVRWQCCDGRRADGFPGLPRRIFRDRLMHQPTQRAWDLFVSLYSQNSQLCGQFGKRDREGESLCRLTGANPF